DDRVGAGSRRRVGAESVRRCVAVAPRGRTICPGTGGSGTVRPGARCTRARCTRGHAETTRTGVTRPGGGRAACGGAGGFDVGSRVVAGWGRVIRGQPSAVLGARTVILVEGVDIGVRLPVVFRYFPVGVGG